MIQTQAYLYKWTHIPTAMWYIGSRTAKRCHPDDGYICSSRKVLPMIRANAQEWERTVLCTGDALEIRNLEVDLLKARDARKNPMSFNQSNGDKGWSTTGLSMSEKSREVWLKKNKGKKRSPEICAQFANVFSSFSAEKIAAKVAKALHTRSLWTPEQKAANSAAVSDGRIGKVFSAEHIKNLSISHKGFVMPMATREKLSIANKGKVKTAEHMAKIVAANKGKPRGKWTQAQRDSRENKKIPK